MGVLSVILLGCIALLSASSSANEDAHHIRGQDNNGLVTMKGCDGYQRGDQWVSSYHHNCICKGPDRLCYPVNCLPGSEIVRDLSDLWNCEVVRSKREITESAKAVHARGKRMTGLEAFGVFSGVVGTIGFILDRIEAAQTTAQLNEIQDQIQELDTKMDELTRSVSDLKLGQEYSQLVGLYARDEQRLRNMIKTLANLQISSGKYILPGHRIQHWADMVLSYGSDGVHEVLEHLWEMVFPSGIFGGKGLFEICHKRLITSYMSKYSEKHGALITVAERASWLEMENLLNAILTGGIHAAPGTSGAPIITPATVRGVWTTRERLKENFPMITHPGLVQMGSRLCRR
ncbi:uncharacterized protein LOC144918284 isoform X2 [Branchiostoma floridae x Branchiostoma belcheri]